MGPAPNPLGLLADALPPQGLLANIPAWLFLVAGACVCVVFVAVAAAAAFLIFKKRGASPTANGASSTAGGASSTTGGGRAGGGQATSDGQSAVGAQAASAPSTAAGGQAPATMDEAAAVEAAMKAALAEEIDHLRAQEILGPYMVLLAEGKATGEAADRMKRLGDSIEEALTVKKYNPSVMAEFGLDRMRILAEVNRTAYRIGDNNRVLVLLDGQPRAATLEQLWDLVMEHPDRCDLRSGEPLGVPAVQAGEMLRLARSR